MRLVSPGIMAAKPNEPPMQALRKWIAALEQAIASDDRATIKAILKDAVPEFGSTAVSRIARTSPAFSTSRFYNLLALGRPVIIVAEPDAGRTNDCGT